MCELPPLKSIQVGPFRSYENHIHAVLSSPKDFNAPSCLCRQCLASSLGCTYSVLQIRFKANSLDLTLMFRNPLNETSFS